MSSNILLKELQEIKREYKHSEFPCLDYCKDLLKRGAEPDSKLEVWNYERVKPEADWIVPNIGIYVKNEKEVRKHRIRGPRSVIGYGYYSP